MHWRPNIYSIVPKFGTTLSPLSVKLCEYLSLDGLDGARAYAAHTEEERGSWF